MATLSRTMKKAAPSIISLANRTTMRPRYYTSSAIFTAPLKKNSNTSHHHHHHHFSGLAKKKTPNSDDNLLSIINSEIHCADKDIDDLGVSSQKSFPPRDFPFKIEYYSARLRTLTLARDYQGGEEIKVEVQQPYPKEEEECQYGRDHGQYDMDLVAIVTQQGKPTLRFKIRAEADGFILLDLGVRIKDYPPSKDVVTNDEPISVEVEAEADGSSLAVKIPNASDEIFAYKWPIVCYYPLTARYLHEQRVLQAVYTYLEVRGIKPSITNFIHDYMVSQMLSDYTGWLKQIKRFIAD